MKVLVYPVLRRIALNIKEWNKGLCKHPPYFTLEKTEIQKGNTYSE